MKILCLGSEDLVRALPMDEAAQAMKSAFAALSAGEAVAPPRGVLDLPDRRGTVLLMGADVPGAGISSKIVSIFHDNGVKGLKVVNGVAMLLNPQTGIPEAIFDGGTLTALRTGAASAAATDLLARSNARVGAVIGTGGQARTQLPGIDAVRELDEIRVAGISLEAAETFAAGLEASARAKLVPCATVEDAVRDAEVICTATNSSQPVVRGEWLADGAHLNGIGSFTLEMAEFDAAAVGRARIFVDSVESALAEAGDLVQAENAGETRRSDWTEIGDVAAGRAPGRNSDEEITFFKSVGHAVQDAAAAALAVRRARELGLGREIEL